MVPKAVSYTSLTPSLSLWASFTSFNVPFHPLSWLFRIINLVFELDSIEKLHQLH